MSQRARTAVAVTGVAVALAACGASSSAPTAQPGPGANPHHGPKHAPMPGAHHGHRPGHPVGPKRPPGGPPSSVHPSSAQARPAGGGKRGPGSTAKPGPASAGTAAAGPAPVAAGTYTYRQTGSQQISNFHSSLPPTSTLVVHPAKANGQQTSRTSSGGKQPPSDQTLLFNDKGMFLVSQVERVALPGRTETIRCAFHPAVPYPPWPIAVGQKQHAHTDCGQVTVTASGRVVGRRTATVGGKTLTVYVINTTLTTSGQATSTSHDTEWFSPALRLSVRDTGTITGRYGPFSFSGTFTRTLTSTIPK